MHPDDVHGDVQFLTGSPQRGAILRELCAQPSRPTELTDRVDATRTTVQRVLAGFCERDWAVKRDGRYRATVTGERIYDRYEAFSAEVQRAQSLGPFAVHIGEVAADLPEAAFEGEVTVATDRDPLAAVDAFVDWFGAAEGGHISAVSPIVSRTFNEVAADLLGAGTTIDYVIDQDVLRRSATDFEPDLERGLAHENIDIRVHPQPLSYGFVVRESTVLFGAYDDDNNLRAALESTAPSVIDWATMRFEALYEASTPLSEFVAGDDEKRA